MDMMDIRRRMMGNTFPSNFIFKEGKGFRKDIEYFFGLQSSGLCSVSDDFVYIVGPAIDVHSSIYIGAGLIWDNGYLRGNAIDTKGFTKLKIDAHIREISGTRRAFFILLNTAKLSQNVFGQSQNKLDTGNYSAWYDGRDLTGVTSPDGRYTIEIDVSNMDSVLLNLWSPDTTSHYIKIYNIWLE